MFDMKVEDMPTGADKAMPLMTPTMPQMPNAGAHAGARVRRPKSIHTFTFVGNIAVRREITTGWCVVYPYRRRLAAPRFSGRPYTFGP